MKIVILERDSVGQDVSVDAFEQFGPVTCYDTTSTEAQVITRIQEAEAVILNKAPLTRRAVAAAPQLKFVGILATGYDNVDLDACRERGIRVANVTDYSTAMVAQHTITLTLALCQKIIRYDRYVQSGAYAASGSFSHFTPAFQELDGKTWGILGMGHIGRRVATIAQSLGCRVITHSLTGHRGGEYPQVDRNTLLAESDVLSLHCPLSDKSRHWIDTEALARMKPTALLINVARGGVVDSVALAEALRSGQIAGAGLDVLEHEPIALDDPLAAIHDSDRLLITPHLAWASVEARRRCVQGVCENLAAFLRGEASNALC